MRPTEQDMQKAAQFLSDFLIGRTEVQSLQGLQLLKVSDQSWVASARINGEKVVVKRFLQGDLAQRIQGLKGELDYIETVFGDSNCQANKCLMAWPDEGVVVLSFAPGQRLGDKISTSSGRKRQQLLGHSGEWLARYTAPRQRDSSFGPAFWVKKLRKIDISHINDPADRDLVKQLIAAMESQIKTLRGCAVVQAATPGDYVGINAHYHKGVIYGVDIQGKSWFPIAKEAARFLVWMQIHDLDLPEQRQSGVAQIDWDAFLGSGVLSEAEQRTTLPFFVGEQLYERYVENYHRKAIRQNSRAVIESYLR